MPQKTINELYETLEVTKTDLLAIQKENATYKVRIDTISKEILRGGVNYMPLFSYFYSDAVLDTTNVNLLGYALQGTYVDGNVYSTAYDMLVKDFMTSVPAQETLRLASYNRRNNHTETISYRRAQNGRRFYNAVQYETMYQHHGTCMGFILDMENKRFRLPCNWNFVAGTPNPDFVNIFRPDQIVDLYGNIYARFAGASGKSGFMTGALTDEQLGVFGDGYSKEQVSAWKAGGGSDDALTKVSFDAALATKTGSQTYPRNVHQLIYYVVGNIVLNESRINISEISKSVENAIEVSSKATALVSKAYNRIENKADKFYRVLDSDYDLTEGYFNHSYLKFYFKAGDNSFVNLDIIDEQQFAAAYLDYEADIIHDDGNSYVRTKKLFGAWKYPEDPVVYFGVTQIDMDSKYEMTIEPEIISTYNTQTGETNWVKRWYMFQGRLQGGFNYINANSITGTFDLRLSINIDEELTIPDMYDIVDSKLDDSIFMASTSISNTMEKPALPNPDSDRYGVNVSDLLKVYRDMFYYLMLPVLFLDGSGVADTGDLEKFEEGREYTRKDYDKQVACNINRLVDGLSNVESDVVGKLDKISGELVGIHVCADEVEALEYSVENPTVLVIYPDEVPVDPE
jgi:hypothetical protein